MLAALFVRILRDVLVEMVGELDFPSVSSTGPWFCRSGRNAAMREVGFEDVVRSACGPACLLRLYINVRVLWSVVLARLSVSVLVTRRVCFGTVYTVGRWFMRVWGGRNCE